MWAYPTGEHESATRNTETTMTTKHHIDGKTVEVTTEWHVGPLGKFTVGVGPHTVTVKLDRGGKVLTDARYAIYDASVYEVAKRAVALHLGA